jgi:hypothetical protein
MLTLLCGLFLTAPLPQGQALSFLDYTGELQKPSFVLVVGTLGKVTEGKKERLKPGEGTLDEGGVSTSVSGTVFAKVQATAKLAVGKALHGTAEPALTIAFDLQTAKLNDGAQKRHFLLTPRVALEDGMLGLFFLEKVKDKLTVTRVLRHDPKKNVTAETFTRLCEDLHALNAYLSELRFACEAATKLQATDRKKAVEVLRKALQKKPELRESQGEQWRRMEVAPQEQKAKELFASLGGDRVEPASESRPGEAKRER